MSDADRPQYEVGYGKPPRAHQFKSGKSGNPRGRPKRNGSCIPVSNALDVAGQPLNQAFVRELYRKVPVVVDGKQVKMPLANVILRSLLTAAAKGNRPSQRYALDRLNEIQNSERKNRSEAFEELLRHKNEAMAEIVRARRAGLPDPPEILPHPDDIIVDLHTPAIHVIGPWTPEAAEDAMRRQRIIRERLSDLAALKKLISAESDEATRASMIETAVDLEIEVEVLNKSLPPRLRCK